MILTQEALDFFWANGYLPYEKVLDDETLETLRREYDAEFEKAWQKQELRNLSAKEGATWDDQKNAPQRMLQIMQMSERNIHYRRLLYNKKILDVVQDLIGPNIMLFHDQALFKPAHTGGPVTWHQDNAYWQCRPATLVSCWLTLDDVDRENGAMQVIPGSHLKPVWHEKEENKILFNTESRVDKSQAVTIDLPAGSCMFHHCQTLHYTQPNSTPRQRRAFAMHFMSPGTTRASNDAEVMRAAFNHPVLRMNM
jgi:ectoine hydroxylase-related dioxygenase (phytanoyl-CoA dioxygenase family)